MVPVDEHARDCEAAEHVWLELGDAVQPVDEGRLDIQQDIVVPGDTQRRVEAGERGRRLAGAGSPGDQNAALGHADGPGMHELTGLVPSQQWRTSRSGKLPTHHGTRAASPTQETASPRCRSTRWRKSAPAS